MSREKCTDKEVGALKHAYELGSLSGDDVERFEIHLLSCQKCFEEVQHMEVEFSLLRSDMSVRREVRRAVAQTEAQPSLAGRLLTYLWPETPLVFKPAVAFIALALLIYPAYLGMMGPGDSGMREIQSITLIPTRSAADAVLTATSGHDGLITFVYPGAVVGKEYKLVIEAEDGTRVMSIDSFTGFDQYETGKIVIPLGRMRPGSYRLIIVDPQASAAYREQVYDFQIGK